MQHQDGGGGEQNLVISSSVIEGFPEAVFIIFLNETIYELKHFPL